ncbi:LacI family DNA-binding transcriptional regulator [Sphingomonas aracearum]|uniref:LacI family DNA-binding transcriptional regulator n=1 Tax=Sphingomonas aracearum TaxID=2283317 RepID=UPI001EF0858D|nr:LacI family DNA-binding transcriptional regulator [Sphingomonas aracearum]
MSRALNGAASVSPATRDRVQASARALGYVPNAAARSLSLARSNTIGVVLPELHGEFFSEIVRGMDRAAGSLGLQLLLSNMHADVELAAHALRAMRGRVDGLLIMAPELAAATLIDALPGQQPAVLINCAAAGRSHPGFGIDNRAGAAAMVRHLLAQGRQRIVHLAGPGSNLDARERQEGFTAAMAELAPGAPVEVLAGDFHEETGMAAAQALLSRGPACDAIFAANDQMAIGAMRALQDAGVDVPGRIAVAGFDDVPVARYLALSTMRVPIAEMGARALARLARLIDGTDTTTDVELLVPELVVRGTTATGAISNKNPQEEPTS